MEDDLFNGVIDLEETYYQEGYNLGVADGSRAGRIEGRVFGLEKGFQKFAAMGMLHGKAAIWASRLPQKKGLADGHQGSGTTAGQALPSLASNARLEKHIQTLFALVEPDTFSTENTEEAVTDFDDRFKRAGAKAKVVERIVGEGGADTPPSEPMLSVSGTKEHRIKITRTDRSEENIEDFNGSRLLS
ncbi:DUF1715-domain-containing protein [Lepidopterella palustris CBS 459.81]|uniref:DUF1715-domain-containing protein n=1 Tax=Lepidopterella palustris CBS 459.81 TaxID=1314670 RepID=A0A8E2JHE5_9PEZI|nr:DUF1715-domain-containing protein [Lepidopterella palustris CBS 459.81]